MSNCKYISNVSTIQLSNAMNWRGNGKNNFFRRNKKCKPSQIPTTGKCYSNSRQTTPQIIQLFHRWFAQLVPVLYLQLFCDASPKTLDHCDVFITAAYTFHWRFTPSVTNKFDMSPHPPPGRARSLLYFMMFTENRHIYVRPEREKMFFHFAFSLAKTSACGFRTDVNSCDVDGSQKE